MTGRFGEYTKEVEAMMQIMRPAIEISLVEQEKLKKNDVLIKSDHSPVSICDFACQTVIVKGIKENFPTDNVLGEEDVSHQDSSYLQLVKSLLPDDLDPISTCKCVISNITEDMHRVWVIDPIDGTYAFIQNGNYAIATALLINFEVVCSIVGWPRHNKELTGIPLDGPLYFVSAKNHGSYAVDLSGNYFQLKKNENPRNRLLYSLNTPEKLRKTFEYIKEKAGITEELQGSSMTKAFTIAVGAGIAYLRLKYKSDEHVWDIAPFELFIREAGCFASTSDGQPLKYSKGGKVINSAAGLIFTSKDEAFHQKTLEAFREAYDKFYK
ncbi:hypothetical protein M9Y10_041367 [Tritrichomonas musculus]|uniref:Inositol monophosphatase family protein n=1 Tax=Tritrichomonas musculus TaxID=1915356 RepID=A0ABR2K473_9EUKA